MELYIKGPQPFAVKEDKSYGPFWSVINSFWGIINVKEKQPMLQQTGMWLLS